jgi:hypothetical protein
MCLRKRRASFVLDGFSMWWSSSANLPLVESFTRKLDVDSKTGTKSGVTCLYFRLHITVRQNLEDSLPDIASRPVRRSFLEPKRQGAVGSLNDGEVGMTTTITSSLSSSTLYERLQSRQSFVPLLRNALEIRLKLFKRFRPELKPAFPSNADTLNHAGIF